jgi:L-threonylcarbamoyladenylate synthase
MTMGETPKPPAQPVTERLAISPAAIERAAERIQQGGLVAFPTETVYGLGGRADDAAAVRAIFAAKGRPPGNPLIVHVAGADAARAVAEAWPDAAVMLAAAFWPGPLTLVVERRRGTGAVVGEAAAGGSTVALRVPAHPVALALLTAAGIPIAAPSANRSSGISPTTADHVLKSLAGRIDMVIDGGPTGFGIESSIVDVTRSPAVLLRHGAVPLATIAALTPVVDGGAAVVAEGDRAAAPGSHARHYAPRAHVRLVTAGAVRPEVEALRARGQRTGALERAPGTIAEAPHEVLPDDPGGYAAGLYAALHRLEDAGCEAIVIAEPPGGGAWAAVRDRLTRASAQERAPSRDR